MLHSHPCYQLQETRALHPPHQRSKLTFITLRSTQKLICCGCFFGLFSLHFILGQSVPVREEDPAHEATSCKRTQESTRGHATPLWCKWRLLPFFLWLLTGSVHKHDDGLKKGGGTSDGVTKSLCKREHISTTGQFKKMLTLHKSVWNQVILMSQDDKKYLLGHKQLNADTNLWSDWLSWCLHR